jgi:subtilisin family serine protease
MRWIVVVLVTLLVCFVQAQDDHAGEPEKEEIAFLVQSFPRQPIDLSILEQEVRKALSQQQSENPFTLEPVIPQEVVGEKRSETNLSSNLAPGQIIVQLSQNTESVCNNLFLGKVSFDGELTAQKLQELEQLLLSLKAAGIGVIDLNVDGNGAHTSDMARPSPKNAEETFKAMAHVQETSYKPGNSNTIIAVLDTGVTTKFASGVTNPLLLDLENAIETMMGVHKEDFIDFDSDPQDLYEDYMHGSVINKGHGTPIALIAHTVDGQAAILPIRVCGEEGGCPTTSVILGVCHALNVATEMKKNLVLNLSFSGNVPAGFDPRRSALYKVLEAATNANTFSNTLSNTFVVGEVGNRGLDPNPRYPAAFSSGVDGLVSVSALQAYGTGSWSFVTAYYSTRGNYIDVAALGSDIYVGKEILENVSSGYSGTSFATPWVVGTVSLMLEENARRSTRLTDWELEYCLKASTQPPMPPVIPEHEVGMGMINVKEAVSCVELFPNYPQ